MLVQWHAFLHCRSPQPSIPPKGSTMTRHLLIAILYLFCCLPTQAAQAGATVVENDHVRLVFATKPVPFLRELVQKPSQKNLLAEAANQNLFTLVISRAKGGNLTIESQSAKQGSIKVSRVAKSQHILIKFTGLGPASDMRVNLSGVLDDAEPFVRWSTRVDNPSRQRLSTVQFPYVKAVPAIGSPDDDFIVAPAYPGVMIENPAKQWPENYSSGWTFPGEQSAQFFSYQDRDAGVYIASMDTAEYGRSLRIAKQSGKNYLLCQQYRLHGKPAVQWQSPYEVALGVTSGTWQQTADIYKRWAVRQPWCARTLIQRDDIPHAWKRGPCIHTVEMRTYDKNTHACNGSYYPKLQEHLRLFREKIDGPVVPLLTGWENHRCWTAGDYFPVFDAANAGRVIAQVHKDGFSPFIFLSGMFFTFKNEGADASPVSGAKRYADSFVIDIKTGKPKTFILGESNTGRRWKRHSYQFCPAALGTKEFFRSVIDQAHALGIDIVQMDQACAGGGAACYSAAHGHQPGPGLYQSQAFHDLLADMRRHGRSLCPDFMLTVEELHEELIPYLDGFHTREYRENWWYRKAPGARGIPLFTYLYHEYAIVYGGEGPHLDKSINNTVVREMAINLATGKTPAASVWSSHSSMAEAHQDQIKMLRNHSHLLKTEAWRFLMLGRMLHPLEFDAPKMNGNDKSSQQQSVLASSWQSPEGLVGHCLVNITDAKQPVYLQLDTQNAPGWAKADVDLYRAEKPDTREHVLRSVSLPYKYKLELAPFEAVFFVIRPLEQGLSEI